MVLGRWCDAEFSLPNRSPSFESEGTYVGIDHSCDCEHRPRATQTRGVALHIVGTVFLRTVNSTKSFYGSLFHSTPFILVRTLLVDVYILCQIRVSVCPMA